MSVDEYHQTINILLKQGHIHEEETRTVARFLHGLNLEIQGGMSIQRYDTLYEALYAAREFEAKIKEMKIYKPNNDELRWNNSRSPLKGVMNILLQEMIHETKVKKSRTRKTHLNAIFDHLLLLLHHNKVTPFSSHHHAVHLESESPPATPSTLDLPPPPSRLRSAAAAFEERRCRHRQLPQLPPPPLLPDLLPTVPLYWFRFRGEHTAWNVEEKLPKMDKGFEDAKSVIAALKSKGISSNSGQIAPLDEIIKLKEQYKFRVLLDESNSFGVLGSSGRGLTEHYRVPQTRKEIGAQYAKHLTESELSEFSKATEGFSGRDIRNVCQQVERHWASKIIRGQTQRDERCPLPPLEEYTGRSSA
nr:cell division control protein 48 isoform X2 [Ipomoea trifida]